jgi:hypothetical protein
MYFPSSYYVMNLGDSLISAHGQDKLSHGVKYNNNNIYAGSYTGG